MWGHGLCFWVVGVVALRLRGPMYADCGGNRPERLFGGVLPPKRFWYTGVCLLQHSQGGGAAYPFISKSLGNKTK